MSMVTDVVMIIPSWPEDAHERVEHLFATHLSSPPYVVEESGKVSGQYVYHVGANYMSIELREALLAGPWPSGSVLLVQHETETRPVVKIFGDVPEGGWDSAPGEIR